MEKKNFTQANRNYKRRFWPLILIYVVLCFAGPFWLAFTSEPAKWQYIVVALSNALPIIFILGVMGKFLKETDEYTREQQMSAMLIGGGIVLSFAVIWGFFELYQIAPSFWSFLYGPMFFAAWGVTYFLRTKATS